MHVLSSLYTASHIPSSLHTALPTSLIPSFLYTAPLHLTHACTTYHYLCIEPFPTSHIPSSLHRAFFHLSSLHTAFPHLTHAIISIYSPPHHRCLLWVWLSITTQASLTLTAMVLCPETPAMAGHSRDSGSSSSSSWKQWPPLRLMRFFSRKNSLFSPFFFHHLAMQTQLMCSRTCSTSSLFHHSAAAYSE